MKNLLFCIFLLAFLGLFWWIHYVATKNAIREKYHVDDPSASTVILEMMRSGR